jgi:hypothetical protein
MTGQQTPGARGIISFRQAESVGTMQPNRWAGMAERHRSKAGFTACGHRLKMPSLSRLCLCFARSLAFRRRGAEALPLQPFHHHSCTGMTLLG